VGKLRIEIQITSLLTVLIFGLFTFSCTKQNNTISSNGEVCEGGNGTISSSGRWQEFNTIQLYVNNKKNVAYKIKTGGFPRGMSSLIKIFLDY